MDKEMDLTVFIMRRLVTISVDARKEPAAQTAAGAVLLTISIHGNQGTRVLLLQTRMLLVKVSSHLN